MQLNAGSHLGPFEILAPLGAGGMGEVFRARDTKLGREVALKILPEAFASQPDRLARFRREAQVLAALNHTNIAAIFGLEESGETTALVLELVEGATLADRLRNGPIPIDETLSIARQIAEALETAHEKGIIHRDLKPANIKITPDDKVKVLDFGLAKIFTEEAANAALSQSPTLMSAASTPGMILGTAAYMSPEQARGKTVDKRTDIWAFGAVVFEMLTGSPAFDGETVTDVLGAIVHKQPDWKTIPLETPPSVRRLLRRCLEKDARQRLHDIADVRIEIDAVSEISIEAATPITAAASPKRIWFLVVIVIIIATIAFLAGRSATRLQPDETALQTEILPPVKPFKFSPAPALSPNGRMVAFNAPNAEGKTVLWVRTLDSADARQLPRTEGSLESFWSPDSRFLAFVANGKLQRIDLLGGLPQSLADAPFFEGGSWGKDGTILFGPTATTIYRIPASGGTPTEVTKLNAARHELIHGWPTFLPDGKHFLLWVFSSDRPNEGVYVGALGSNELQPLLPFRTRAQYANGYLFFGRQGDLHAQKFDPDRLKLSGEPIRVASGLTYSVSDLADVPFSVSDNGNIIWSDRPQFPRSQPTWLDRNGQAVGIIGEPGVFYGLMASPDGKYAATELFDYSAQTVDILLLDIAARKPARSTFVNYWAGVPIWSPDSRRLLFTQWRDYLDVMPVTGGAADRVPFPGGTNSDFPLSWSPDGQNLLLLRFMQATRADIWILPMSGDHKPRPYLNTPVNELDGRISPDGHWVAYTSDESGRNEVFVQSFPLPGNKKRVSSDGGSSPIWRGDGRELFFVTEDHAVMAASIRTSPTSVEFSTATRLFTHQDISGRLQGGGRPAYAPAPDGQHFLVLVPVENDRPEGLHYIQNWKLQ